MYTFLHIFGLNIPMYGVMIVFGIVSANVLAYYLLKRFTMDVNDFFILEAYTFLGAFFGAKGLYLWVSRDMIDWRRIFEIDYFNTVMQGGFVFYGGLIGGLLIVFIAGKLHRIDTVSYVQRFIFLIPWIHAFGRVGCFYAGCCYGIPYDGKLAVVYPKDSLAPGGIELFPVQLVEAVFLLSIAGMLLVLEIKKENAFTIEIYLISYSILRYVMEYFRADTIRGQYRMFSTSQWISIFIFVICLMWICLKKYVKYGKGKIS